MNGYIPDHWVEITHERFDEILKDHNYKRDAWSNGIFYLHVHSGERFAILLDDGKILIDPNLIM